MGLKAKIFFLGLSALAGRQSFAMTVPGDMASSIIDRLADSRSVYNEPYRGVLANPALAVYRQPFGLNGLTAGFGSEPGHRCAMLDAGSLVRLDDRDVFTGEAGYDVGFRFRDSAAESADLDMVHPYTLADTVSGRQNSEAYRFGLGFARRSSLVGWGVTGNYRAGLSYRNRDPRPRNVSGRLDLGAGMVWHCLPRYSVAVSGAVSMYKQSSSITFYSELGEDVVYHLTGLGTTYVRFNSLGKSTGYKATGGDVSLSLFPRSASGLTAMLSYGGMNLSYTLRDLNNLELSRLNRRRIGAEVAWRCGGYGRNAGVLLYYGRDSRRGTENIFGDPSTGIYPRIASLEMYRSDIDRAGVRLSGEITPAGSIRLSGVAEAAYTASRESYAQPWRCLSANMAVVTLRAAVTWVPGARWLLRAEPQWRLSTAASRSSEGFDGELDYMSADCLDVWRRATDTSNYVGIALGADRVVSGPVAAGLTFTAGYDRLGTVLMAGVRVAF